MVNELCSGPCLVLEIQGPDAPQTFRELCGPADPVSLTSCSVFIGSVNLCLVGTSCLFKGRCRTGWTVPAAPDITVLFTDLVMKLSSSDKPAAAYHHSHLDVLERS